MDDIVHQNRELGDCLEQMEAMWEKQEHFSVELCRRIEMLQVHLFPRGYSVVIITNVLRIRPASVGWMEVGRFPLKHVQRCLLPC